jgi:glycosyltransferase involved in cell wall biosynthesis
MDALEALSEDSDHREELINRGWARARGFTWQKTAEATAQVYRTLL